MASPMMTRDHQLYEVLRHFGNESPDGIGIFDFGEGRTVMPMPSPGGEGGYLTTRICYLVKRGKGKPAEGSFLGEGKVADLGGGWKFFGVAIPMDMTPAELLAALEDGKEKLLAVG